MTTSITEKKAAVAKWAALLHDSTALLATPGVHHKILIKCAGELHSLQIVSPEEFSDMLELADGALAYAIEAQLDLPALDGGS
ncbi:hypothetical protein RYA05_25205 [Pseudomonas syringae pv. actinidiae]|uniref:Uncharacterized protein n=2 Tax=Pseudomonas syringae group TaxID=136849 RepID=A0AAN4PZU0_PSESF|nr:MULTISPECIES: hypothetical protein [Pseudomonas syringae group]EPN56778.1 hypothetical protein A235_33952 [Pseudomonas syringae pv. actinidiae ICMP 19079]EPN85927.1 hypothetical protein A234_04422 [Pseudomonas syringae pv. actinidiae ICMP 19101]AKT28218.1 hypothetical protein IYO_001590 [Pseudomonas syringae pv. actinidiae ICMP 18884]AOE54776.1 hypothetical protein NZ708_01585 [Pseudomonas syringae pv. actinidiae ICMP 18708]APP95639.1 hypothetical protein PsaNZ45_01585 [Pseudomonas syringae